MDDLEELRKTGITATKALHRIKEHETLFSLPKIKNSITGCIIPESEASIASVMRIILLRMDELHENSREIEKHNKKLKELNELTVKHFYQWMANGHYCAIGYDSIDNPKAVVIDPKKWNFLEIDFERGSCTFENTRYFGLRFLSAELILSLPQELQELLEPETKPTQTENKTSQQASTNLPVTNIGIKPPTTIAATSPAKKSKKVQVIEKLKKITPYLKDKYPSPKTISITHLKKTDTEIKLCVDLYDRHDNVIRDYLVNLGFQPGKPGTH